jgi:hypothetical protein
MNHLRAVLLRSIAVTGLIVISSAAVEYRPSTTAIPGMTFRLKVTLRHSPPSGRPPRALTMLGHGLFGGGHGRVDIDTVDSPGPFRKGDFIIIQDTLHSIWARPSDLRVRRMDAPLVNPLEGISERLAGGPGMPSDLKVDFDTVSLDETINGAPARHFRITADATYPLPGGNRQIHQKVVVEQWLAKIPVSIVNPFGSRIRGLPDIPTTNGDYRAFLNTLAAANRVFGEAVAVKTVTTTSYNYGNGAGEDYFQTVELLDLMQGDIDEKLFVLPDEFRKKQPRD